MTKASGTRALARRFLFVVAIFAAAAASTDVQAAVTISSAATANISCVSGVCTPTAADAILNVTDLTNMLASSNVQVNTGTGELASQVDDIVVSTGFSWTSSYWLILEAYRSVTVKKPVMAAGITSVQLESGIGGVGGTVSFPGKGRVTFMDMASHLSINGTGFSLVNSINSLASAIAAQPGGNFALANDYDATPDGVYSVSPITTVYTGVFEGAGNTISHLSINDPTAGHNVGLFSEADSPGAIRDLVVSKANVTGSETAGAFERVGTLVGYGSTSIFQSSATGKVTAGDGAFVGGLEGWASSNSEAIAISEFAGKVTGGITAFAGGLAGINTGTIAYSSSAGAVISGVGSEVGGLIGENTGPVQNSNSSATVSVSGTGNYDTDVGGLIGYSLSGAIDTSHATGAVKVGNEMFGGGLIGENSATITDCYATGNVHGTKMDYLGGLSADTFGNIDDSFATGTVDGDGGSFIGGFVGHNSGTLTDDYSLGDATGSSGANVGGFAGQVAVTVNTSYSIGKVTGGANTGGFVGYLDGTYSDDYWDTTTSGEKHGTVGGNEPGITGLTDTQLKAAIPTGFNPQVWGQAATINKGYPYLLANPPPKH